jgi:hypothetical protein
MRVPLCVVLLLASTSIQLAAQTTNEVPPPPAHSTPAPTPLTTPTVAATPQDLDALAKQLAAAHGLAADATEVKSFRAEVHLEPRQGESLGIDVNVDFLAPRALRCRVIEKGVRAERGFDPKLGAWALSGDEVVKLQGPEHNAEADQVARELRLCQQMVRFLNPGRFLGALTDPAPVRHADLEITARLRYPSCTVIEGTLASFPTYALGTDGRARVTLYLDPATRRLLAVQALPLGDGDKPGDLAELILLGDYSDKPGLWLPTKLSVYRLAGPGREVLMTVHIRAIELGKEFPPQHFARPTK